MICPADPKTGLLITVHDQRTEAPISTVTGVIASDDGYREMLHKPAFAGGHVLYGAQNRAGTYEIQLEAPGYTNWIASDVTVPLGVCKVVTVDISALMAPS